MTYNNLTDEDLLRHAQHSTDPLVQELAKRLAERIDGTPYREPSHWSTSK